MMETLQYIADHLWTKLVIIAAFLATIEKLWKPIRWGINGTKKAGQWGKRAVGAVKLIEQMDSRSKAHAEKIDSHGIALDYLMKEFKPNGGSSLKDQMNKMEMQVQELAKKNKVDMEMSHHGIFQCDMEGRNSYVNKTYANMIGVTKEELLGRNWEQYIESDDYLTKWEAAFEAERDFHANVVFIDVDGTRLPCKISATRFGDGYAGYIDFQKQKA